MASVTMKSTVHPFQTDDPRLRPIHDKVLAQQELDPADIAALYAAKDILAIGWLANFVRERMHGNDTCYTVNSIATSGDAAHGNELLLFASDFDATLRAVERTRREHPKFTIAALTVEELAAQSSPAEAARRLRESGADVLLGDSAEIFLPEVRRAIWRSAASPERRAEARQAALDAGLKAPLYVVQRDGAAEQQARELLSFRGNGAESFAAVSFDPDATTSVALSATTGMQEMKHIAIARLALTNVAHIRASWQMLGGKLVQIALRFGASEIDGTALDPNVNPEFRRRELAREISVAGREPKEIPPQRKLVVIA